MVVRTDNQLIPLKTQRNEDIQDFPMTLVGIDRANSPELNRLLQSYSLPAVGIVAVRKIQLKNYLGIAMVGIETDRQYSPTSRVLNVRSFGGECLDEECLVE